MGDALVDGFLWLQDRVWELVVQPLVYALGFAAYIEDAYTATGTLLMGAVGVVAMVLLLVPLERSRAVEAPGPWRAVAADVAYTLIHRLGLFGLIAFAFTDPVEIAVTHGLIALGLPRGSLLDSVPLLRDWPGLELAVYVLVLDFVLYWVHRGQHGLAAWWALHALHHSQRHMTLWSNDRNHLLDDALIALVMVVVGTLVGLPPADYAWFAVALGLVESLSHANARLDFGPLGERLLVSPRYHRAHHAIGDYANAEMRSCNFAVLFPVWDMLFGTADFRRDHYPATGIMDDDFGDGLLRQQAAGLRRLVRLLPGGTARRA